MLRYYIRSGSIDLLKRQQGIYQKAQRSWVESIHVLEAQQHHNGNIGVIGKLEAFLADVHYTAALKDNRNLTNKK